MDGEQVKIESMDKGTQVMRAELVEWLKGTQMQKEWNEGK